ncbi:GTP-binding protein [Streptomyces sp. HUAS TT7]|uniref:GTP-binding protein n=1 Tax=Streptomyces sp. HUAS TT7 TaxID=3447507 RepID=UPI003F65E22C
MPSARPDDGRPSSPVTHRSPRTYGSSDYGASDHPVALKILVAGGFGVGKTTLVSAVSQSRPLRTEAGLTAPSRSVDDTTGVRTKSTTTVVMDFGRIDIREGLALYLFGTPGQDRFRFMWDELAIGALGGVILADTRRFAECFSAVDFFESRGIPFIVGVNCFDDSPRHPADEVRTALDLAPDVHVELFDARSRADVRRLLATLVDHARVQWSSETRRR